MSLTIDPEPSEAQREAVLEALRVPDERDLGGWAAAALVEGVEGGDLDP